MVTGKPAFLAGAFACLFVSIMMTVSAEPFNEFGVAADQVGAGGGSHHDKTYVYTAQDTETAHSLFMHHSAGIIMIVLSAFVLMSRLRVHSTRAIRTAIGATWVVFGLFIFVNGDPEGWPVGPASLSESFVMPTASEWLQHKVLSLIPMLFGLATLFGHDACPNAAWTYAAVGLAALGSFGLLFHQHSDHPGTDIVNMQHRMYSVTILLIGASLLMESIPRWRWPHKSLLMPFALMMLGLELVLYVE